LLFTFSLLDVFLPLFFAGRGRRVTATLIIIQSQTTFLLFWRTSFHPADNVVIAHCYAAMLLLDQSNLTLKSFPKCSPLPAFHHLTFLVPRTVLITLILAPSHTSTPLVCSHCPSLVGHLLVFFFPQLRAFFSLLQCFCQAFNIFSPFAFSACIFLIVASALYQADSSYHISSPIASTSNTSSSFVQFLQFSTITWPANALCQSTVLSSSLVSAIVHTLTALVVLYCFAYDLGSYKIYEIFLSFSLSLSPSHDPLQLPCHYSHFLNPAQSHTVHFLGPSPTSSLNLHLHTIHHAFFSLHFLSFSTLPFSFLLLPLLLSLLVLLLVFLVIVSALVSCVVLHRCVVVYFRLVQETAPRLSVRDFIPGFHVFLARL